LRLITAAYRKDDFQDADGYVVQAAMLLERFRDVVIAQATDPITGIQSHVKFPPSLAELHEFCDEISRRSSFPEQWDDRSRKQLAERLKIEADEKAEPVEYRREIAERIKNELKAKGFQFTGETKAPTTSTWRRFTDDDLRAIYPRASMPSQEPGN
jgi:hypothetical protein